MITAISTLDQVKSYLRIPEANTIDDVILQTIFMPAAQDVIEREIGIVVPRKIRGERFDGGKPEVYLRNIPVLYIENVQEGWGYYNWNLDDQEVNTQPALSIWSYSLDVPQSGLLTRRGPGNVLYPFVSGRSNIRVDYVAGRESVPPSVTIAFLELCAHWYRTSQLRNANQPSSGFNNNVLDTTDFTRTTGVSGMNFGVPEEIIEMLKPYRREPLIG